MTPGDVFAAYGRLLPWLAAADVALYGALATWAWHRRTALPRWARDGLPWLAVLSVALLAAWPSPSRAVSCWAVLCAWLLSRPHLIPTEGTRP
jgi:hypothetical protein